MKHSPSWEANGYLAIPQIVCFSWNMNSLPILKMAIIVILTFTQLDLNWLQSTFVYDIIFAWHLNFCTWFTKNFIISGTKKDLIMD